jgi:CRP-like cAMP-binding protein
MAGMAKGDVDLLTPFLEALDLPLRYRLEAADKRIEYAYFLDDGIASVVAQSASARPIEVGLIGREGMTGLSIVMGTDSSPFETYMQVAGRGRRIQGKHLLAAIAQSTTLQSNLLRYGQAFFVQSANTAMCNGRAKIEERLARWLLMAHDRLDGDKLPLTHEFLSIMLGVRRPGVTVALNLLVKNGLISARRGIITVIDRKGLEASSKGAYGAPETEFKRLFGGYGTSKPGV